MVIGESVGPPELLVAKVSDCSDLALLQVKGGPARSSHGR